MSNLECKTVLHGCCWSQCSTILRWHWLLDSLVEKRNSVGMWIRYDIDYYVMSKQLKGDKEKERRCFSFWLVCGLFYLQQIRPDCGCAFISKGMVWVKISGWSANWSSAFTYEVIIYLLVIYHELSDNLLLYVFTADYHKIVSWVFLF